MPKTIEQWLLFKYVGGEFTPLWRPFKTRQLAEKARSKYPERERKTIGIGVIRAKLSAPAMRGAARIAPNVMRD